MYFRFCGRRQVFTQLPHGASSCVHLTGGAARQDSRQILLDDVDQQVVIVGRSLLSTIVSLNTGLDDSEEQRAHVKNEERQFASEDVPDAHDWGSVLVAAGARQEHLLGYLST